MVLLSNNQDLTAGSGIINHAFLEQVYHSVMDEALSDMGRTVTFHLKPEIQQDADTQGQPAPSQYNPFFSRVPVPRANTRNTGVRIEPRDVEYDAQIVVGPLLKVDNDVMGIGDLASNQAMITVVIEALNHVKDSISVSIEGRRYSVENHRPIGFSQRRYLMVLLTEIQEKEARTPDNTVG